MSTSVSDMVSVRDYVAGRLSATEREAFEERLASDSGLVRELEDSLRMREALEVLRELKLRGEPSRSRRRALHLAFACAAAAALAAVGVSLTFYYGGRSPPIVGASLAALRAGSSVPPAVLERYAFAAMRDTASMPELVLPASGALELRALTPVTDPSQTFRVALAAKRGQQTSLVGRVEHLVPDADGFLVIYADAARLQPGDYWLSVEPDDHGTSERFAFRLKSARN
jgi:anti-sigma-K factor RskA